MRTRRLTNLLTGALAIGCVLLGSVAVHQLLSHPFASARPQGSAGQDDDAAAAERRGWTMPPASEFAVVVQRPLFTPGRRPPREPGERAADVKPQARPAMLLGAVVSSPERKLALLEGRAGVVLVPEGADVEGWQLVEIHAEHVILRAGGARYRVNLKDIPAESGAVETRSAVLAEIRVGSDAAPMPFHQPPLITGPEIEPPADDADASGAGPGR